MATSVRLAIRQLDNLIDITISSVPESERANHDSRAVGLGVMGFTDVAEKLGLAYETPEAADRIDRIVEFVSWHAIDASADLARERGAYSQFAGSGWSLGKVPFDTLDETAADRGVPVEVDRTSRMDWDALRTKVTGGIRNATVMAIAPTASIGLVAGTTPGLDPQFSQIFSRATSSGKFLEVNRNLVADLQALGLWEQVRDQLLAAQGDLSALDDVPDHLKAVYKTSFQLSPYAFLEVAARAQKWIDQSISRNIYLADRDVDAMTELYATAWRKGVKTTYYLHMKPRHTAEQSTVRVNKTENLNTTGSASGRGAPGVAGPARTGFAAARGGKASARTPVPSPTEPSSDRPAGAPAAPSAAPPATRGFVGFGASRPADPPVAAPPVAPTPVPPAVPEGASMLALDADTEVVDGVACPVDPMERLQCDSCQ